MNFAEPRPLSSEEKFLTLGIHVASLILANERTEGEVTAEVALEFAKVFYLEASALTIRFFPNPSDLAKEISRVANEKIEEISR